MKAIGILVVMGVALAGCASSGAQVEEAPVEAREAAAEQEAAQTSAEERVEAAAEEAGAQTGEPMALFEDGDETVYPYRFVLRDVAVVEGAMSAAAFTEGLEARVAMMGECFPGTLALDGSERWSAEVEVVSEYGEVSVGEVTLGREAQGLPQEVRACLIGDLTRVRLSEEIDDGLEARVRVDFAVQLEE